MFTHLFIDTNILMLKTVKTHPFKHNILTYCHVRVNTVSILSHLILRSGHLQTTSYRYTYVCPSSICVWYGLLIMKSSSEISWYYNKWTDVLSYTGICTFNSFHFCNVMHSKYKCFCVHVKHSFFSIWRIVVLNLIVCAALCYGGFDLVLRYINNNNIDLDHSTPAPLHISGHYGAFAHHTVSPAGVGCVGLWGGAGGSVLGQVALGRVQFLRVALLNSQSRHHLSIWGTESQTTAAVTLDPVLFPGVIFNHHESISPKTLAEVSSVLIHLHNTNTHRWQEWSFVCVCVCEFSMCVFHLCPSCLELFTHSVCLFMYFWVRIKGCQIISHTIVHEHTSHIQM